MGNAGGRPLMYESPEDLKAAVDLYFDSTPIEEYTVTGLALALGTSRQVLSDYQSREGYSDIIKWAKCKVENAYELSLRKNGRSGDIFALKNFGWKDQQDHNIGGQGGESILIEFVGVDNAG